MEEAAFIGAVTIGVLSIASLILAVRDVWRAQR